MIECTLGSAARPLRRILCLGAHCDDIEIGCGGTILRLLRDNPNCEIHWQVFSSSAVRKREALRGADMFLKSARARTVVVRSFKDGYFPSLHAQIKNEFEKLKTKFQPDLILTHYRHDLHQDHRIICELTWNTFRDHLILEYEIPKYDGDLGAPNFFVQLDRDTCERKAKYIYDSFASQQKKQWFTTDVFLSLHRLRGIESNAQTKYAEAFHCRKAVA